jgi:ribosomal protein L37E
VKTYRLEISGELLAITCLRCGRTSYSRGDIDNRYCAHCKMFHDDQRLEMWTVYDHPKDQPDSFVARKWCVDGQTMLGTSDMFVASTLGELRALLPPGLHRLPRNEGDDPTIVETWL